MALSAFFLMFFLIIHLAVNITSLFSEDVFNQLSHFMGTNPLVQFALQPVLIAGVIFPAHISDPIMREPKHSLFARPKVKSHKVTLYVHKSSC